MCVELSVSITELSPFLKTLPYDNIGTRTGVILGSETR